MSARDFFGRPDTSVVTLTPAMAKKHLAAFLAAEKLPFTKLTAKTVDFTDLARASKVFVTVHGWAPAPCGPFDTPASDTVKAFGKRFGFVVDFKG
jgi:hypothetical protein